MLYQQISVRMGRIYEILMNSPDEKNRLTNCSMDEIVEALNEAANDRKCYAIIFGAVGDTFCLGGGQLKDFRKNTPKEIMEFGDHFIKVHTAFKRNPKPVICAVEGEALGGGFSLVEACDLAVCADSAQLSISELQGGLAPAMGLTGLFEEMPKKVVMELGLMSRKLSAREALEYGIVNRVVPRDQVMQETRNIAECFSDKSPTGIALFKEVYRRMGMYEYERRMEIAQSLLVSLFKSNDGQEVITAKQEGRFPIWSDS